MLVVHTQTSQSLFRAEKEVGAPQLGIQDDDEGDAGGAVNDGLKAHAHWEEELDDDQEPSADRGTQPDRVWVNTTDACAARRTATEPGADDADEVYDDDGDDEEDEDWDAVEDGHVETGTERRRRQKARRYVYVLTVVAGMGGFLFGYDTGVIGGAMLYIQPEFMLDSLMQEVVVSATVAGAMVAALFAGGLNNFFGRRITIMIACGVFVGGALVMASAAMVSVLVLGRVLVGIGIGFASMTVPIYIAEAAPEDIRGALVSTNVLMITTGQFVAYAVNAALASVPNQWRWMLGVAGVPALLQLLGMCFLPESPRYLLERGQQREALLVLQSARATDRIARLEMRRIQREIRRESAVRSDSPYWDLVTGPQHRRALIIGVGLQLFQQLCGINTVMYYSATILKAAGFESNSSALYFSMIIAAANMLMTLVAIFFVDRVGRKPLLLLSLLGISGGLVVLMIAFGLGTVSEFSTWLALAGQVFYIVAFAPGMGPMPWTVNSEIYQLSVRAAGNSLATASNWTANLLVSMTFLSIAELNQALPWLVYLVFTALAFFFVLFLMPETKGRSLEEIQRILEQGRTRSLRGIWEELTGKYAQQTLVSLDGEDGEDVPALGEVLRDTETPDGV